MLDLRVRDHFNSDGSRLPTGAFGNNLVYKSVGCQPVTFPSTPAGAGANLFAGIMNHASCILQKDQLGTAGSPDWHCSLLCVVPTLKIKVERSHIRIRKSKKP